jgi:hypothetical protein
MTRQAIQTNNEPGATDGKVGYKHPPVKSQFRKGQSGNPRGRRKGQRNLPAVLAEVLRQTVTVKQDGKAQRMSKGEALIRILLTKAHNGDRRAIKAMIELSEKIGRIEIADLKLGGRGNYEFMLIPGMAASAEEWQREIDARHETAALRESIAAVTRATGTTPTASQIAVLRESIVATSATGTSPTPTRRPVNRRNKVSVELDKPAEQPNGETAAPPQTPAVEPALPSVPTAARTGTYRKVNRRQPASPTTAPDA